MGPEHTLWWHWPGMWIFPMLMFAVIMIFVFFFAVRRWGCRAPWSRGSCYDEGEESETALEILKKRYARGEITKDEFQQMKKDILS